MMSCRLRQRALRDTQPSVRLPIQTPVRSPPAAGTGCAAAVQPTKDATIATHRSQTQPQYMASSLFPRNACCCGQRGIFTESRIANSSFQLRAPRLPRLTLVESRLSFVTCLARVLCRSDLMPGANPRLGNPLKFDFCVAIGRKARYQLRKS